MGSNIALRDAFDGAEVPLALDWDGIRGDGLGEDGSAAFPPAYNADHGSAYTKADRPATKNQRCQVELEFTVLSPFEIFFRAQSSTDYTADKGFIRVTPGQSGTDGWATPDTIEIFKTVSTNDIVLVPTGTPNRSPVLFPSVSGTTVSLRGSRIKSDDLFELLIGDDQLIVRVNHIVRARATFDGIDAAGYMGIVNKSGSGDNKYKNWKTGDWTPRYVTKHASASDSNGGTNRTTDAWATIAKGGTAQLAGEICFVGAGTYSENLQWSSNGVGRPRTGVTSLEDTVMILSIGGEVCENASATPWLVDNNADQDLRWMYWCGIDLRCTTNGGNAIGVRNYVAAASYGHVWQDCGVYDAYGNGIFIGNNNNVGAGADKDRGDCWVIDAHIQGCGRKSLGGDPSKDHGVYASSDNNIFEYIVSDGSSYTLGKSHGIGIQLYYSGSSSGTVHTSGGKIRFCEFKNYTKSVGDLDIICGILIGSGTDIEVVGNYVHHNHHGIINYWATVNPRIENNIVVENDNQGIDISDAFGTPPTGTKIQHNTIVNNGAVGLTIDAGTSGATTKNNLIYGNNGTYVSTANNLVDNGTGGTTNNNHIDNTDPLFADLTLFKLTSSSPARGAGDNTVVLGSPVDFFGTLRDDGAVDIGAHEFPNPAQDPDVMAPGALGMPPNTPTLLGVSVLGNGNSAVAFWAEATGSVEFVAPAAQGTAVVEGGV